MWTRALARERSDMINCMICKNTITNDETEVDTGTSVCATCWEKVEKLIEEYVELKHCRSSLFRKTLENGVLPIEQHKLKTDIRRLDEEVARVTRLLTNMGVMVPEL